MIGIKVEKAHGEYDPGTSKFFGSPTMPEEWLSDGTIGDEDFFFCQLKLSEFKNDLQSQITILKDSFARMESRQEKQEEIVQSLYKIVEENKLVGVNSYLEVNPTNVY